MRKLAASLAALTVVLVVSSSPLDAAQGVQTGMLTGFVSTADGLSLPGVRVTVTSASLQGQQAATTDLYGNYLLRGLPPGTYEVRLDHPAMKPVALTVVVQLGGTARLNVTMTLANIEEQLTVVAASPSAVVTPQAETHFTADEIDKLPGRRTPVAIAALAPGLTTNTPNAEQVTISGAFAYDNVFLIDGVDVDDNLFAQPEFLFVEDAISETQVLSSGISAEYGRFSGGVVNIITKSGGNRFSGSFRVLFTNPSWTNETPFEKQEGIERDDTLNAFYQGTFGGPIRQDRLWFFAAGRYFDSSETATLDQTGAQVTRSQENRRGQIKITGSPAPSHTVQGNFVTNGYESVGPAFDFSIDPATFVTGRRPNTLFVVSYKGVITPALFAEVQYSEKRFGIRDSGGTSTNIVDSPFFTVGFSVPFGHYNAPAFDATDPEDRDNHQFTASASYTWTSAGLGSHDTKVGFENFVAASGGGSSFSSTGFQFFADYKTDRSGRPVFDTDGHLIPLFGPGFSGMSRFFVIRGARTDITTRSLFVADRWAVNEHWSLNLGFRYESARSDSTVGIENVDTSRVVPRVAGAYDPRGDGRYVFRATYAHYAGKYTERVFGRNDPAQQPGFVDAYYIGPPGEGRGFAPAFDPSNYWIFNGSFPTDNLSYADDVRSPLTREVTVSAAMTFGTAGFGTVAYTRRSTSDFVESFVTIENGTTTIIRDGINFGTFDNRVFRNSNEPQRDYQGLQFLGRYRLSDRWSVTGNWTVQIQNEGDFEGEFTNYPGVPSCIGEYPEILVPARSCPTGNFSKFQRHKVRLWSVYDLDLGRFGRTSIAALYRYDSALTYSLSAGGVPISSIQQARDPGYASPPRTQFIVFGKRGAERFNGHYGLDLGLTHTLAIGQSRPYIELEIFNLFNNDKLIFFDTTVVPDLQGPVDEDGIPTTFTRGPRFGQATGPGDFPLGRTVQVAFGIRF